MTADRTPKPCKHPRANHQHGTHLAYRFDQCRCAPCATAGRRHGKATAYRTVTGTHSYVPAGRTRAHVEQLLEVLTVSQIEQRSGVHRTAIRVLVGDWPGKPASRRITRKTETALLAVTVDRVGVEQHGWVDGTGTRRRFRALVALGWPARTLGARLGFSTRTNWSMTSPEIPERQRIRASTRDAVRALYDELSLTVPPRSRYRTIARNIAAARGWAPPMAWDDDSIDDPAAVPFAGDVDEDLVDDLAVEHVLDGHSMTLTGATLEDAALRLAEAGHDYAAIADRVGSDATTVRRVLNTARKRLDRAAREDAA